MKNLKDRLFAWVCETQKGDGKIHDDVMAAADRLYKPGHEDTIFDYITNGGR